MMSGGIHLQGRESDLLAEGIRSHGEMNILSIAATWLYLCSPDRGNVTRIPNPADIIRALPLEDFESPRLTFSSCSTFLLYLFGGPHNKDYIVFGSVLGSPYFAKLRFVVSPCAPLKLPRMEWPEVSDRPIGCFP